MDTTNIHEITPELAAYLLNHQPKKGKQRKRPVSPPKTALLKVRMTDAELEGYQEYAISKNTNTSHLTRQYIRKVINLKKVKEQED